MELHAIYTIWLREIIRFRRDKFRFIGGIVTPILYLVIMGVGLGSSFAGGKGGTSNYIPFILPGIIGMALLFTSIFSGVSVIFERQFGFLKEMLVAPITRGSVAVGKIAGSASIAMINGLILILLGLLFGIIPITGSIFLQIALALTFMVLICVAFVSLGLSLAAKMTSMEGFQFIMSFLVMPVFLLSGTFFPIESLPGWMKIVAYIDPLQYGVDGLRGALLHANHLPLLTDLGVLIGFALVMILITKHQFESM